jgi:DNA-binding transcriptional ArsR family regulator
MREEPESNHPIRVAILATLSERGGLTSCELLEHMPEADDRPQPLSAIVYHLRVLLGVGLVTATDNPDSPRGTIEKVWALP